MKLSKVDLRLLHELAVNTARQAGAMIQQHLGMHALAGIKVQTKAAGTSLASQVVTEVDMASDKLIRKHLQTSCERYELAMLTEEQADDAQRLDADYFWCVDPLDGTLPFTQGRSGYAVSIALVAKSGEPIIGAICEPISASVYSALKGGGAYRNAELFQSVGREASLTERTLHVASDESFLASQAYPLLLAELNSVAKKYNYSGLHVMQSAGAVMNACKVLQNPPACYFKLPKRDEGGGSVWDFAATAAIFNELGLWVSDVSGEPLNLNPQGSTYMNRNGILYASDASLASDLQRVISHHGV